MKKEIILFMIILSFNLSAQNYFQQEVNYIITVELNDKTHSLTGMTHIDYTNNSTNDLELIWFHLWPNAYKNKKTALAKQKLEDGNTSLYYANEKERGYINNLDFKVNGVHVNWDYHPEHIDICKLILNKPLRAGESMRISTPFFVKIPDAKFSRLGHVDQSYMITQWYPKPAVYDKNGWHTMPYLDQGEFYSEFGSFDVSITLPSNYTVGATGDLQNKKEIARLNNLAEKTDTITKFSDDMSFPKSYKTTKTLRYIQNNIHDFGWFADKRYHVLKGKVELPNSKEKVTLWTMFTNNEADLWKNSIEYMHDAVYYYSLWNGNYPYKHCTAVDGTISAGGGMEYPNVTVIGESGNKYFLEEVIMHEVGHNWFYGILGSNERTHPWMDEGLNSHNEMRYMRTKYHDINPMLESFPKSFRNLLDLNDYTHKQIMGELGYFMNAWIAKDQPIELHSSKYTPMNYGSIVYSKTAIAFDYLMSYIGKETYDKCMKIFFERWKYKHPDPNDLRNIFEEISGKELGWFFDDMIKTTKQLDYAIIKLKKDPKGLYITLKNKGEINGPLSISGIKGNIKLSTVWIDGFKGEKTILYTHSNCDYVRIDSNEDMPEINRNNNIIRVNGLFKKIEPIKMQIIGSLYHPKKTQIFFHPMMNYNIYNKHSVGLKLYNQFLPKSGISYSFSPLYSFGTKDLKGTANVKYTKYSQKGLFHKYIIGLDGRNYMYDYQKEYIRIEPSINIQLAKPNLRSKIDHYINTSYVHLTKKNVELAFIKTKYIYSNANTLNPYSIHLGLEHADEYRKVNLSFYNTRHLNQRKRLNIRGYFGFINTTNSLYNIKMSAWSGKDDYMFSEKSFSRTNRNSHNIPYQQQIFIREGGLKHFTNDSLNSKSWLSSLSLKYNLMNPLHFYIEAGTNSKKMAYGSGFILPISINTSGISGGLELYLPFLTEEGLVNLTNYGNILRFNLYLETSSLF